MTETSLNVSISFIMIKKNIWMKTAIYMCVWIYKVALAKTLEQGTLNKRNDTWLVNMAVVVRFFWSKHR